MSNNIAVSILAAGLGKRLRSQTPKPFHNIAGLPMIAHLVQTIDQISPEIICIVLQEKYSPLLREALSKTNTNCKIVETFQTTPKGTGDATKIAWQTISKLKDKSFRHLLVAPADTPLIESDTFRNFISFHQQNRLHLSVIGFYPQDKTGYGRILIKDDNVSAIVEEKDCSKDEKNISLCYSGIMIINTDILSELLPRLNNDNSQKEFYITGLISLATEKNLSVGMYPCEDSEQFYGINSRSQLAEVEQIWQKRKKRLLMDEVGVTLIMPETIILNYDTKIEADAIIGPYVVFGDGVHIGRQACVAPFSQVEGATLNPHSKVGPFARIRANTYIGDHARVGNFVEVKNSTLSKEVKASHLAYIGDTNIKEGANIGAGVIVANYDGSKKHQTLIKKSAFVGSNVTLVAPLTLGEYVKIAAGSVITDDVSDYQIAFARSKQTNKDRKK